MHSFTVIAGFVAAASAAAVEYPAAYNTTVPATTLAPYEAAPSAPAYTTTEVISSTTFECSEATTVTYGPSTYIVSSSTVLSIPQYTATYEVKPTHSAVVHEVPAVTTTAVVSSTVIECPEPTTVTYGHNTYVVSSSTVLSIPEHTTTYEVKPTHSAVVHEVPAVTTTAVISSTVIECPEPTTVTYGHSTYVVSSSTILSIPEHTTTYEVKPTHYAAVPSMSAPVHPGGNGTVPAGTAYPSGSKPSATKPSASEFTGAAGKATVGFMAIAGAVAAFL